MINMLELPSIAHLEVKVPKYISVEKAAELLGVDGSTIRRWAKDKKIKGAVLVGEGRRAIWRIPPKSLVGLERDTRGKPAKK